MRPEMGKAPARLAGGVIRSNGRGGTPPPPARGAVHSAEIEYALGNLATNKVYAWTPDDYKISALMEQYFANFIKTGNPNGANLPEWPAVKAGGPAKFLRISAQTEAETEKHRSRYLMMDKLATSK